MAERKPEQISGMKDVLASHVSSLRGLAGNVEEELMSSLLDVNFINRIRSLVQMKRYQGLLDGMNWREGEPVSDLVDLETTIGMELSAESRTHEPINFPGLFTGPIAFTDQEIEGMRRGQNG